MAGEQFPKHIYSVTFFESWNNKRQCLTGKRSAKHMQLMPNVSAAEQALFFYEFFATIYGPLLTYTNCHLFRIVAQLFLAFQMCSENVFPLSGTSAFMTQAMAYLVGQLDVWY